MGKQVDLMKVYREFYREFGAQGWWPVLGKRKAQSEKCKTNCARFEIMVGAILTQNTAWKNVETAIWNLIAARALDPQRIVRMSSRRLRELIRPAGYFRQKAKKLKIFSKWYLERYRSARHLKTDELRKELLAIWGIGPETADSILLYAFCRPVFVVDAYTRRLCDALKASPPKGGGYHDVQKFFTDRLPRSTKLYNEFHALIVAWGKKNGHTSRRS